MDYFSLGCRFTILRFPENQVIPPAIYDVGSDDYHRHPDITRRGTLLYGYAARFTGIASGWRCYNNLSGIPDYINPSASCQPAVKRLKCLEYF